LVQLQHTRSGGRSLIGGGNGGLVLSDDTISGVIDTAMAEDWRLSVLSFLGIRLIGCGCGCAVGFDVAVTLDFAVDFALVNTTSSSSSASPVMIRRLLRFFIVAERWASNSVMYGVLKFI
jgi:hypothetical protein